MLKMQGHPRTASAVLALGLGMACLPTAFAQGTAPTTPPTTAPVLGAGPAASSGSGAMAGSHAGKLASGDRTFVEKAAAGGMAEVAAGKLAQEKGSSDGVKQFGARMVAEHTKANDELMQIATSKGIQPPADVDRKHKTTMDKLSKLSGAAFDREYVKGQVADHKDTAKLMDKEAKSGRDADLKAFAAKTLPVVQEHLQMVVGMDDSMKNMKTGAMGSGAASMAK